MERCQPRTNRQSSNKHLSVAASKHSLSHPLVVKWPQIPNGIPKLILATTLSLLQDTRLSAPPNRLQTGREAAKKHAEPSFNHFDKDETVNPMRLNLTPKVEGLSLRLDHIVLGINSVTKRLERQLMTMRSHDSSTASPECDHTEPPIALVLACLEDIEPPILVQHVTELISNHNSEIATSCSSWTAIQFVALPKGAEAALAASLGVRRAAVIAFDRHAQGLDSMLNHLVNIIPLTGEPSDTFLSSQVKMTRTLKASIV